MDQAAIWDFRYRKRRERGLKHRGEPWIAQHLRLFEEMRGKPIVDLGCGGGENAVFLHDLGCQVIACDFSPVALEQLNELRPELLTRQFDMTQGLPVPDGSVGIVLASLSTHYFDMRSTKALYADIARVLVEGGYFLLKVNSLKEYEAYDRAHVVRRIEDDYYEMDDGVIKRYFTVDSLTALLESCFEVLLAREEELDYLGNLKYSVEGLARKA